jgi:hypothetical protein
MKKVLSEQDILRIMREEWRKKISLLKEEVEISMKTKIDGKTKEIVSPDLKVRHKESQILYTVVSIGPKDIILKTPEGEDFIIDRKEFEDCYELD